MNPIAKSALASAISRRAAREARYRFLQSYAPAEAQALLDELHSAWHLQHDLNDDESLLRIYRFYKYLAYLMAADYTLLKEGRRWQAE